MKRFGHHIMATLYDLPVHKINKDNNNLQCMNQLTKEVACTCRWTETTRGAKVLVDGSVSFVAHLFVTLKGRMPVRGS